MKKIIVSVTNDLTTDQRVDKVCTTLQKNGFDVLLVGRHLKNSIFINRTYKTKRLHLWFAKGFLFYAEYNIRLFFFLLFSKKDSLLSNDLDTLLANFLVSKIQQKKLIYDSHELFSEIPELIHKPFVKSVWQKLENYLLPKLKNTYTVSQGIANYYNKKYVTNFKVVRNLPLKKEVEPHDFSLFNQEKKIILYQGAVNIGRGLELMIDTMPFLDNCIFVIIGEGDVLLYLKQKIIKQYLEKQVLFLGKMTPEKLQKITPLADIGISFEEDLGLNYHFALPNKIFDYIQAEIPVLVSDLPEMKQIVLTYQVGEIIENRTPEELAAQIKKMLKKDFSKTLKTAKKELVWENEEQLLMSIF
ncbi:glycosyltransferase [Tenacibaculum sp. UWU-22]|uniref:glycosyltransferase n=1 Tax=Tenacibaculum sp. UWU-22 TaxID=3234187 RepID=UPI0034DB118D